MKKIALYGGTFNPIHNGHILALHTLVDSNLFDEVHLLPAGVPPFKEAVALNLSDRLHMCELVCDNLDKVKLNKFEANKKTFSYTYETLTQLEQENPTVQYYWTIGYDNLFSIETWHQGEELLKNFDFGVMNRGGFHHEEAKNRLSDLEIKYKKEFILLEMPNVEIASTTIRNRIVQGQSIFGYTPKCIIDYIYQRHLYS